jgi:hypothetical protein
MRQIYTLPAVSLIMLIIGSSCSSTHKVSQTPDDVYYSPASPKTPAASSANSGDQDEYYSTSPSDQYVRMKTVDQSRWSYFDDYNNYDSYYSPMSVGGGFGGYYGYPAYGYGYGYGYSPMSLGIGMDPYFGWNSYFLWNTCYNPYFYNPYYGAGVVVVNPKFSGTPVYSRLRSFSPASYNGNGFANGNNNGNRFYRPGTTSSPNAGPSYRYNNNNSNFRPGNTGGSNGGSSRSFSSPATRSFAPSGGGGFGGGGGGFRPGRH